MTQIHATYSFEPSLVLLPSRPLVRDDFMSSIKSAITKAEHGRMAEEMVVARDTHKERKGASDEILILTSFFFLPIFYGHTILPIARTRSCHLRTHSTPTLDAVMDQFSLAIEYEPFTPTAPRTVAVQDSSSWTIRSFLMFNAVPSSS